LLYNDTCSGLKPGSIRYSGSAFWTGPGLSGRMGGLLLYCEGRPTRPCPPPDRSLSYDAWHGPQFFVDYSLFLHTFFLPVPNGPLKSGNASVFFYFVSFCRVAISLGPRHRTVLFDRFLLFRVNPLPFPATGHTPPRLANPLGQRLPRKHVPGCPFSKVFGRVTTFGWPTVEQNLRSSSHLSIFLNFLIAARIVRFFFLTPFAVCGHPGFGFTHVPQ